MNLYVGNLSQEATEDDLQELFQSAGQVKSVKIIFDHFTKQPRGFGFVEMSSAEEGQKAISTLNGAEVKGQAIKVNEARPKEPREFTPRNRDNRR